MDQTPLHLAAWQGDIDTVGMLLAQTARTSEKTKVSRYCFRTLLAITLQSEHIPLQNPA